MKTFEMHKAKIKSGQVDDSTVRALRMALNATERKARGYSLGHKTAYLTDEQRLWVLDTIPLLTPHVVGDLEATGRKILRDPRYRTRLEPVRDIIMGLRYFTLRGFDAVGQYGMHFVPVYRAHDSNGKSFPFQVIPWQSGGDGPQIMSANYW